MPIILGALCLLPLQGGMVIQYLVRRLAPRKLLYLIPAAAGAAIALLMAWNRWRLWTDETVSPLTQILFIPGLPALCYFIGLIAGWRIYKRLWDPRVVDDP